MEKIKEKETIYLNLGNKLRNELALLKKLHGPDRKIKKTDACFADFKEYQKVEKEKKAFEAEMKTELETIKKNAIA